MREGRVFALDTDDRLAGRGGLTVVERLDREVTPRRLPERGELPRDVEDLARDELVGGPVQRWQREPRRVKMPLRGEIALEQSLGLGAVAVAPRADVEDRERLVRADDHGVRVLLEDLHPEAFGDDHARDSRVKRSRALGPVCTRKATAWPASASRIRSTCLGTV